MSVNVGTAVGYLDLDTSGFKKGFSSALSDLKTFQNQSATSADKLSALSSAATSTGRSLTKYLTLPLLGVGAAATKTTIDFDAGMSKVQSISGATSKELETLRDKAIEMGAKTKFSASESAEAFQYMAMAGWDTAAMLDGIEGLMSLAAASGEDLATTSDIVTDALTAFGLKASDSAHFADVLARASSRSNTNVSLMGNTFKYVAPVAGALGYSIEDTAVAIGLMANAGIKGSRAGTSLRTIFTRLTKPVGEAKTAIEDLNISITNADGTVKPFNQTMLELREKFSTLTDAQKAQYAAMLAGQEGMSGLLSIVNASDEDFAKLTKEINNADGAADEMAEVMMNNLSGALEQASGAVETLLIRIGDVMTPMITKTVNGFTSFVEKLSSASDGTIKFAVAIGGILASLGPMLLILGHTATNILSLISLYNKLTRSTNKNTTSTGFSITAMKLQAAVMAGAIKTKVADTAATVSNTVANSAFGKVMKSGTVKVLAFAAANKVALMSALGFLAPIIALIGYMYKTGASVEEVAEKITNFADKLAGMIESFAEQFPAMIDSIVESITAIIGSVVKQIPILLPAIVKAGVQLFMGLVKAVTQVIPPLVDAIPTVIKALTDAIVILVPAVIEAGVTLLEALVKAIPIIVPELIKAAPKIVKAIIQGILTLLNALFNTGVDLLKQLWNGINSWIGTLGSKVKNSVKNLPNKIKSGLGSLFSIGRDWLAGLWEGISSRAKNLLNKIDNLGNQIQKKLKNKFKIKSPSRWMRDMIGKMMMTGWARGIVDNAKVVLSAVSSQAEAVKDTFSSQNYGLNPEDIPTYNPEFSSYSSSSPLSGGNGFGETNQSYKEGDTFNFYSPKALTPMESAKQMKKAKRDLAFGY